MDIGKIAEVLADIDAKSLPPRKQARWLEFRGGGGSSAWNCRVDDDTWYVVKCQNNPQEQPFPPVSGQPVKIVTTELICGRLGQLFSPPVCPETIIIDVPDRLALATPYPHNNCPISAGANVGSRRLDQVYDSKSGGGATHLVPPEQLARVVVFQTWLNGQDPAALISTGGSFALSIDHGWYLTGPQWIDGMLTSAAPSGLVLAQWPPDRLRDASLYRGVLDELMALAPESIIRQFAGIPAEWGVTPPFAAKLAAYVLQRRAHVEHTVDLFCKGAA